MGIWKNGSTTSEKETLDENDAMIANLVLDILSWRLLQYPSEKVKQVFEYLGLECRGEVCAKDKDLRL